MARKYVSITEIRSVVIAVDDAPTDMAAVGTVLRAYRNGDITLSHNSCIVDGRTVIKNETADWEKTVTEGYDDSHFRTIKYQT